MTDGVTCVAFFGVRSLGGKGKEKAKGIEVDGDWSVLSILLKEVGEWYALVPHPCMRLATEFTA